MNIKYFSILIFLVILITGCYKTDDINSELGEPILEPKDNPSDPVDHYIFEFYTRYGSFIQYDYDTTDYQWNINTRSINTHHLQDDKIILNEGLKYLNKALFSQYDENFKQKYFPTKIFLADSIKTYIEGVKIADNISNYGYSNLSVGRIRAGLNELDSDSLSIIKGKINADFWAGYLFINERFNLPYNYYKISEEYYEANLLNLEENEDKNGPDVDTKQYGFWENNNSPRENERPDKNWFAPDQQIDIWQFINMITSHTKEEMDNLMSGYNMMKDKYNIIIDYVKENYNVDLQEIGNHNNL